PASPMAAPANCFTVTAKDAFGNTATGYTGTVAFTSSDSQAVLPAKYTFGSGDAGVDSFSATLNTTGAQSITATDTVNASITGTESGITVSSNTHLSLAAPSTTTAGSSFSLTVTAKDANNNTLTSYLGTVHFTSTDPAAVLPANYTFTAVDA